MCGAQDFVARAKIFAFVCLRRHRLTVRNIFNCFIGFGSWYALIQFTSVPVSIRMSQFLPFLHSFFVRFLVFIRRSCSWSEVKHIFIFLLCEKSRAFAFVLSERREIQIIFDLKLNFCFGARAEWNFVKNEIIPYSTGCFQSKNGVFKTFQIFFLSLEKQMKWTESSKNARVICQMSAQWSEKSGKLSGPTTNRQSSIQIWFCKSERMTKIASSRAYSCYFGSTTNAFSVLFL